MKTINTPLRYPGGKQKLSPFIAEIIQANGITDCGYIEPYAGGAGVAMDLLVSGVVSNIYINDTCPAISAFWEFVINDADNLCKMIKDVPMTIEEWLRQREIYRSRKTADKRELGFSLLYLNRCNRSGIMSGGVIGGLQQAGQWKLDARFPKDELIRRIQLISSFKRHIHAYNMDAEDFIKSLGQQVIDSSLIYFDPPYYNKADRLYANYYKHTDHVRICDFISNLNNKWILSYDGAPEIIDLYSRFKKFTYSLQYNAGPAYKGSEVFVFSENLTIPVMSSVSQINTALTGQLA